MLGRCSAGPLPVSAIRHIASNSSRRHRGRAWSVTTKPAAVLQRGAGSKPKIGGRYRVVGPRHRLCFVYDVGKGSCAARRSASSARVRPRDIARSRWALPAITPVPRFCRWTASRAMRSATARTVVTDEHHQRAGRPLQIGQPEWFSVCVLEGEILGLPADGAGRCLQSGYGLPPPSLPGDAVPVTGVHQGLFGDIRQRLNEPQGRTAEWMA